MLRGLTWRLDLSRRQEVHYFVGPVIEVTRNIYFAVIATNIDGLPVFAIISPLKFQPFFRQSSRVGPVTVMTRARSSLCLRLGQPSSTNLAHAGSSASCSAVPCFRGSPARRRLVRETRAVPCEILVKVHSTRRLADVGMEVGGDPAVSGTAD